MIYDQVFDSRFKLLKNGKTVFTDRGLMVNLIDIPIEQLLFSPYMYEEQLIAFVYDINF